MASSKYVTYFSDASLENAGLRRSDAVVAAGIERRNAPRAQRTYGETTFRRESRSGRGNVCDAKIKDAGITYTPFLHSSGWLGVIPFDISTSQTRNDIVRVVAGTMNGSIPLLELMLSSYSSAEADRSFREHWISALKECKLGTLGDLLLAWTAQMGSSLLKYVVSSNLSKAPELLHDRVCLSCDSHCITLKNDSMSNVEFSGNLANLFNPDCGSCCSILITLCLIFETFSAKDLTVLREEEIDATGDASTVADGHVELLRNEIYEREGNVSDEIMQLCANMMTAISMYALSNGLMDKNKSVYAPTDLGTAVKDVVGSMCSVSSLIPHTQLVASMTTVPTPGRPAGVSNKLALVVSASSTQSAVKKRDAEKYVAKVVKLAYVQHFHKFIRNGLLGISFSEFSCTEKVRARLSHINVDLFKRTPIWLYPQRSSMSLTADHSMNSSLRNVPVIVEARAFVADADVATSTRGLPWLNNILMHEVYTATASRLSRLGDELPMLDRELMRSDVRIMARVDNTLTASELIPAKHLVSVLKGSTTGTGLYGEVREALKKSISKDVARRLREVRNEDIRACIVLKVKSEFHSLTGGFPDEPKDRTPEYAIVLPEFTCKGYELIPVEHCTYFSSSRKQLDSLSVYGESDSGAECLSSEESSPTHNAYNVPIVGAENLITSSDSDSTVKGDVEGDVAVESNFGSSECKSDVSTDPVTPPDVAGSANRDCAPSSGMCASDAENDADSCKPDEPSMLKPKVISPEAFGLLHDLQRQECRKTFSTLKELARHVRKLAKDDLSVEALSHPKWVSESDLPRPSEYETELEKLQYDIVIYAPPCHGKSYFNSAHGIFDTDFVSIATYRPRVIITNFPNLVRRGRYSLAIMPRDVNVFNERIMNRCNVSAETATEWYQGAYLTLSETANQVNHFFYLSDSYLDEVIEALA